MPVGKIWLSVLPVSPDFSPAKFFADRGAEHEAAVRY